LRTFRRNKVAVIECDLPTIERGTNDTERILIVEDDVRWRTSLAAALAAGYMVRTASGGREAVALLRRQPVDIILLDMIMSEGDGLAVLTYVGTMKPKPRVVVVSALDDVRKVVNAMKLGADDYLVKPCSLDSVREALAPV
jgi:DNA-binding response OmpR family regulator